MTALGAYRVPEENLPTLIAKLDKLARRSGKLGLAPISYGVSAPFEVPFGRRDNGDRTELKKAGEIEEMKRLGKLVYVRFVTLTLEGETPRLAGWAFVATLQHLTDDTGATINMLRSVPSFKANLPDAYRTASSENCDHCHKRIKSRKETFIVTHEDGRWLQVGRTCTQDFLGGIDPHAVASQLENILRACASCEESEGFGGGGHGQTYWPIETLLNTTAALVRVDGWTSRGRARSDETLCATADSFFSMMNPPRDAKALAEWKVWAAERKTTPADIETADKALAHANDVLREKTDRNDYEHNLYVATTQASIGPKLVGITASLIAYYLREIERLVLSESRRKATAGSVHFGAVGKRGEFVVTCSKLFTKEGQWGTTYIHSLVTPEGNVATWFASSNPEMKLGVEYRVKATVKSHGDFKGTKQTILTRVAVLGEAAETKATASETKAVSGETKATSDETTARRKAAAHKAVATRRANLAALKGAA